jgi:hypothetical protein
MITCREKLSGPVLWFFVHGQYAGCISEKNVEFYSFVDYVYEFCFMYEVKFMGG